MRPALIVLAVLAFLAVSALVARWLQTDNVERARVVRLLERQAAGDVAGMLDALRCTDGACRRTARANARRLRARAGVRIARYDSETSHALTGATGQSRVVWLADDRPTTVQCVLVRREGNPLTGFGVTLLRLSAPIGLEASCP